MTDESHDVAADNAVEKIMNHEGVIGATVVPIDEKAQYGFSSYINEQRCTPSIDGNILLACHRLGLSLLRRYPSVKSLEVGDVRIRLQRWNALMVAASSFKNDPINKSMTRIIRRAGTACDRPDPDDTVLGKELGKLERSDPAVGAAGAALEQMAKDALEGKFG